MGIATTAAQVVLSLVGGLAAAVALNVLWQLIAPRDPTKPPYVFHYVPWFGCAASYGQDPMGFLEDCRQRYGPVFTYPLLGRRITCTLGPLGSNFILNGKLAHVNAEEAYTHLTTPVFGTEVVYDVPNHVLMEQKKFVKFGLTTENFRKYTGLIRSEVRGYMSGKVYKEGQLEVKGVDAFATSSEITILTASATLQGREVRAALDESFAQLYHDLDGGFTPLNFVFPNLPLPSYRRRDRAQLKMREFYISILEKRRASAEEPDLDMLTALQNQEYKTGESLTDKQIAHIMIALLMAGQHTSAATGAWGILRLGENPELQQRLYDEQLEYHLDKETNTLKPLTYENMQTPLLMAFIKELLRVHAPLHSIMRKIILDYPVPASVGSPAAEPNASASFKKQNEGVEYVIPKGEFVLAAPGFSQLDEAFWGPDAKEFNTDRWLGSGAQKVPGEEDEGEEDYGWGKISKGGKSAYLPFGAGRHRCIGEQFANVQLGIIIATLVRENSWNLVGPFPGNDYTTMIVMPLKGSTITFKRRETSVIEDRS